MLSTTYIPIIWAEHALQLLFTKMKLWCSANVTNYDLHNAWFPDLNSGISPDRYGANLSAPHDRL